jgi:hypothetical protein
MFYVGCGAVSELRVFSPRAQAFMSGGSLGRQWAAKAIAHPLAAGISTNASRGDFAENNYRGANL